MKLTILQENLLFGLNTTSKIAASRSQLPILSNLLLKTENGRLKISATNLETGINLWLGAKVEKEGAITVPARIFSELINLLPKTQIVLETEGEKLKVSCTNYQSTVLGINAAEFPNVPTLQETKKLSLKTTFNGLELKKIISRLCFAAATDEGRPVLTGVLLQKDAKDWSWVATDGYRLSLKKIQAKQKTEGGEWLIPARTLIELGRLIGDESEKEIKMAIVGKGNQVIWGVGEVEVFSKLIEGKFPDFEKVIPEQKGSSAELDREALTNAVKAAVIFARDTANIVKIRLLKGKVEVSANAPELGENVTQLEASVKGELGEIAFNGRYLLEFLNAIQGEIVEFYYSGMLSPGLFKEKGEKDFLHVIMPVKIQE